VLKGFDGNENFFPMAGADTINGGGGNDTVVYTSSPAAV
jgi:hypothetical protein